MKNYFLKLLSLVFRNRKFTVSENTFTGSELTVNQQQLFQAIDLDDGMNFYEFSGTKAKTKYELVRIYTSPDGHVVYVLELINKKDEFQFHLGETYFKKMMKRVDVTDTLVSY